MVCCDELTNTTNCTDCEDDEEDEVLQLIPNAEILFGVVLLCVFLAAIIGNFLTFIVVTKMKSWKNSAIMFIIHLAMLDIIMSISSTPLSIYALFTGRTNLMGFESKGPELQALCNFLGFSWVAVRALVPLTNLSIAIDRTVAIKRPLKYSKIMNWKCVIVYLIIWWLIALHFSFVSVILDYLKPTDDSGSAYIYNEYSATCYPNLIDDHDYKIYQLSFMVITVIVPFILISTLSMVVIVSIWRREAASSNVSTSSDPKRVSNSKLKTKRATTTLVIVSSVFLFCWLPYTLLVIINECTEALNDYPTVQTYLVMTATVLITLNSATNPLIFIIRSEKYRQTVLDSFGRFKAKMETYKNDLTSAVLDTNFSIPPGGHDLSANDTDAHKVETFL